MQIEHLPWLPKNRDGVEGQKIAVVGYSHYLEGTDYAGLTDDVVKSVISGEHRYQFFQSIQGYFDFPDDTSFWNNVLFLNFLPDAVGSNSEKYAPGTPEQLRRGRDRFLRIVNAEKPDKVFVFTRKGWRAFPETTLEELSGGICKPLIQGSDDPNWGTYMAGEQRVLVCGFRHPLFARADDMRRQVKAFLDLRP